MGSKSQPVRVAIVGGGIAGATLFKGLLKQGNTDVQIFEASPNFKESGAGVAVLKNGKAALELIGPSAVKCLELAGSCPLKYGEWDLARGPHSGERVHLVDCTHEGMSSDNVHRATFLRAMLADIPPSCMHISKELEFVDRQSDESLVLNFKDGTTHECDILVGADGIRSLVRQIILGKDSPASFPAPTGWWYIQIMRPYEEIRAILGDGLVDIKNHVEHCYMGDGAFWLNNILKGGEVCQIALVGACNPEEVAGDWRREVTREELIELFSTFPAPVNTALEKILHDTPKLSALYMWDHPHAATYVDGAMCIMGDAAHATTPWLASGGGVTLEDALILSTLLGRAQDPKEARIALKAYDELRRPRTQKVVDGARKTGKMSTGPIPEFDMNDLEKIRANMTTRLDWIVGLDMKKHADDAVQLMDQMIKQRV